MLKRYPLSPSWSSSSQCTAASSQLSATLWFLYPSWAHDRTTSTACFRRAVSSWHSGSHCFPRKSPKYGSSATASPEAPGACSCEAKLGCPGQSSPHRRSYSTHSTQIASNENFEGQVAVSSDSKSGIARLRVASEAFKGGDYSGPARDQAQGLTYDAGLIRRVRVAERIHRRMPRDVPEWRQTAIQAVAPQERGSSGDPRNWSHAVRLLNTHTPRVTETAKRHWWVLMIPEKVIDHFCKGLKGPIIDLAHRYQCHVDLLDGQYSHTNRRPLALYGRSPSLALVKRAIEDAVKEIASSASDEVPVLQMDDLPPETAQRIKVGGRMVPKRPPIYWEQIIRPATWTHATFAAYVWDLCHCLPAPRTSSMPADQKSEGDADMVRDALVGAFSDRAARSAATRAALNEALMFLERHNMVPAARFILDKMLRLGLDVDAGTFNIRLLQMAEKRDASSFTEQLHVMIRYGIRPNAGTWVALMVMMDDYADKLQWLGLMQRKGLLEDVMARQSALERVLLEHAARHLDNDGDIDKLLRPIDEVLGPGWLSASGANIILDRLGRRGLLSESVDQWESGFGRNVIMDTVSVNTILSRCGIGPKPISSEAMFQVFIRVLRVAHQRKIDADHITYKTVLWRAQAVHFYNVARVAWRYACMACEVTHPMRYWALNGLYGNVPGQAGSVKATWSITYGKVIVGIKYPQGFTPAPQAPALLSSGQTSTTTSMSERSSSAAAAAAVDEVEIMADLCGFRERGEARTQALATLKAMWRRDLEAHRWIGPAKPFWVLLSLALQRDLEWAVLAQDEKTAAQVASAKWKVRNAIDVPTVNLRQAGQAVSPRRTFDIVYS